MRRMSNRSSRRLLRTDTLDSECIRSQREMKVFTFIKMLYECVPFSEVWRQSTRPISCTISCQDGGGPRRKHVVQWILLTPQFAADVQGMHQMRGRVSLLSLEVCVAVLMSANGASRQNDAIKKDFSMRPHSPVNTKKIPLLNGSFVTAADN